MIRGGGREVGMSVKEVCRYVGEGGRSVGWYVGKGGRYEARSPDNFH
jgi:hypothetical protein